MNYENIAKNYIDNICMSDVYNSDKPNRQTDLLLFEFNEKIKIISEKYVEKYPNTPVYIVETYRSNVLQEKYFNRKASKIKKNGMHHYGIAVDLAFLIDNKVDYNGDYELLRKLAVDEGLYILDQWDKGHVQYIPVDEQDEMRKTVDAYVRLFQRDNDLTADGIIGSKTINKIKELYKLKT